MCGINGVVWRDAPPEDRVPFLERMNDALAHRGPDDVGTWHCGQVDLGHRRLSVIDTSSASRQPMVSADGEHALVYNGEIYNYLELRKTLQDMGHVFQTEGDTEVLLEGFAEWGLEVFSRCNGMFAAAVYSRATETLVLVRDRLGIKPLFYSSFHGNLSFSSEIAPLLQDRLSDRTLDSDSLHDYLQYLYIPAPATIYRGIKKLRPGHCLTFRGGDWEEKPYWKLQYRPDDSWTLNTAAERLGELLGDSVRLRRRSDVPLGAFLSGGVDSSAVVATLSRQSSTPVKTFSIGFDDPEANELGYARAVAERYGTDHHEAVLSPDVSDVLPGLVRHMGEPFADSSLLPMWLVSKMAREHVTVVLSGDGGDELFAGYSWAHMNLRVNQYRKLPSLLRHGLGSLEFLLPDNADWNRFRRFHGDSFLSPALGFRRRLTCFDESARAELLRAGDESQRQRQDGFIACWDAADAACDGNRMLHVDTSRYLPDDILAKVDRMSMAHGLEARVPLLDHRVVEFAATLPFSLKYDHGQSKRVLKHAMAGFLPKENLSQRKRGFSLPLQRWMRDELNGLFCDTVLDRNTLSAIGVEKSAVEAIWQAHQSGAENYGHQLWALLVLALWCKK
jgi:asparagine synthase (glutamine-hydrolysing)